MKGDVEEMNGVYRRWEEEEEEEGEDYLGDWSVSWLWRGVSEGRSRGRK